MQVQSVSNQNPSFQARFINNQNFREVVDYAFANGKVVELRNALSTLKHANKGDIVLVHGEGYSKFTVGKNTVNNSYDESKSFIENSYNAILRLGALGKTFKSLFGEDVKYDLTYDDIIKRYSKFMI